MSTFNVVCAGQKNDMLIELLKIKYEIIFVLEIYVTCEIVFVIRGLNEVMFLLMVLIYILKISLCLF